MRDVSLCTDSLSCPDFLHGSKYVAHPIYEALGTMIVRETNAQDWVNLKTVRLEALLDAPTAFGVSYQTAINYTDERWQELVSSESGPHFWLAFDGSTPIGMIGVGLIKPVTLI
ncbi:hypothetical protein D9M71_358140 [compost metagenome]